MSESNQGMNEFVSMYRVPATFMTILVLFGTVLTVPPIISDPSIIAVYRVVGTVILSLLVMVYFWSGWES